MESPDYSLHRHSSRHSPMKMTALKRRFLVSTLTSWVRTARMGSGSVFVACSLDSSGAQPGNLWGTCSWKGLCLFNREKYPPAESRCVLYTGLNSAPFLKFLSMQNVTWFVNRAFADVVKLRWGRTGLGWAPNPVTSGGKLGTERVIVRSWPHERGGRDHSDAATAKESLGLGEAEKQEWMVL